MRRLGRVLAVTAALLFAGACGGSRSTGSANKDAATGGTGGAGGSSACRTSLDCGKGQVCDKASGQCVDCLTDKDCNSGDKCVGNVCRPPCTSDKDCTPLGLLCDPSDGACVQCIQSTDCSGTDFCASGVCKAQVCDPGKATCQGNGIATCNADGSSLGTPVPCGGTKVCVQLAGGPICEESDAGTGGTAGAGGTGGTGGVGGTAGTDAGVPPTCSDNKQDGDETGVDCGGPTCPPCGIGSGCHQGSDCTTGVCTGSTCQGATCSDGVKNQDETDIDCGGATCPACGVGSTCNTWTDCATQGCANGHCVVPCAAGTVQCDGSNAKVCDGHGGFSSTTDCTNASQVCVDGLGCLNCVPGTGSCNGDAGTYCKNDGSGYATETCDSLQGMSCNASTGRCDGACAPKSIGSSYQGCDYFPTVTANLVSSSVFHFAIAVSNTTSNAATVTVTKGPTTINTVSVAANSVQLIDLPWIASLKGPSSNNIVPFPASIRVNQGAYRVRSTQPVAVYQFNPLEYALSGQFSYTNDASLLLPTNAWGSSYRGIARHHFAGSSGFVAITAGQDNTTVTLTPGPQTGQFKTGVTGIAANGGGTITLNTGDVVELVSNGSTSRSDPNDPTGILVNSDKPVQVIGGHQCTFIPDNDSSCDHLEESIFPIQTLADTYVVTAPRLPNSSSPKVEMVRIVSTQDNTTLAYSPAQSGAPGSIAKAGGWVELANNANSFAITASHPVYVMQYMEGQQAGGGAGDPAMAQAVTPAQYRSDYLFHAPTNYTSNFVNIVAPTGAAVSLDGAAVGGFTAIGATGYSVARAQLSSSGNGDHSVTASQGVGVSVYGYGQYTSYWYPGGLNLKALPQN